MGTNDITGDRLISKLNTPEYEEGWDKIFKEGKKKVTCDPTIAYAMEERAEAREKEVPFHWVAGWEGEGGK
jgi:hypothetical protein